MTRFQKAVRSAFDKVSQKLTSPQAPSLEIFEAGAKWGIEWFSEELRCYAQGASALTEEDIKGLLHEMKKAP